MGAREGQRRRFEFFSYQRPDDVSIEEVAEKLETLAQEGNWGKRTEAVLIMKFCTMFPAHIANELAVLDGRSSTFQEYVAAAIRAHDAQFLLPQDNSPNRNLRTLTDLAASISEDKSSRSVVKHESFRSPRKKVKIENVGDENVVEEEVVDDMMEQRDDLSDDLDYDIVDEEPSPSGSPIHEEIITDSSKARRTQAGVDEVIFVVPVTNDQGEITDYVTLTNEEAKDDSRAPSVPEPKPKSLRPGGKGRPVSVKGSTNYNDRPYACDLCEYRATQKAALITHMRRHTGEKPYACDVCGYKTSFHASFLLHMTIHTGMRTARSQNWHLTPIKREKTTAYSLGTSGRISRKDGEKPHCCDECGYKTSIKMNLVRHKKSHTGDKPFACGFCDLRTTRKENMVKHIKKHHPDTIPAESE